MARANVARQVALFAVPQALGRRDGRVLRLPSAELVPGDVILLEAGAQLPADARLIESAALRVSESALTGESDAVEKDARADLEGNTPRDPREALVTWRFGRRMLAEGAWLAAGVLSAYLWVIWQSGPGPRATTTAFMALVLIHPFQAMNCRSERFGWWRLPAHPPPSTA